MSQKPQEEYEDDDYTAYDERLEQIQGRVLAAIEQAGDAYHGLLYSGGDEDGDELPRDNLNEVTIQGACRIMQKHNEFKGYWGEGGRDFESAALTSPTWLELCLVANRMLDTVKDFHHCFLEAVEPVEGKPGVYRFVMGS